MLESPLMRASRRRSIAAVLAAGVVLLLAACGSDKSASPTTSTSSTPGSSSNTSSSVPATFPRVKLGEGADDQGRIAVGPLAGRFIAQTVRDRGNQMRNIAQLAGRLRVQYPEVELVGADVTATPTKISALSSTLDAKQEPGAKNPYTVAFAVMDTAGKCVAGVSYGFPVVGAKLVSYIDAEMGACNAQNALEYGTSLIPH